MAKYKKPHVPKFRKMLRQVEIRVKEVADKELEKFAWELQGILVNGIVMQRFASFTRYPLTEQYAKWKRRKGLDERVMIATGHYINSITVIQLSKYAYEVNVPENEYAVDENRDPTKLKLRALGAIHEYGSAKAGVPPRVHWRVILRVGRRKAPAVAEKIAEKAARLIRRDFEKAKA